MKKGHSSNNTKIFVEKEKYLEIIGFTSYAYFTGQITKYSGMAGGRMRTLGEYLENFIYGRIAEEAFKLFLENELGLQTLTEVDVADFYQGTYLPDIVALEKGSNFIPLNFWIDVKEVRRDQKWLLVSASSVRDRSYDAYVAVWVGLPEEHVIWLIKNVPEVKKKMSKDWLKRVNKITNNINKIPCEIRGFASWNDISAVVDARHSKSKKVKTDAEEFIIKKFGANGSFYFDGNTPLYDPDDPSWKGAKVGENIGFALRRLEQSSNWDELASLITKNKRIIPKVNLKRRKKNGAIYKTYKLPTKYDNFTDCRNAYQTYFEDQLDAIRKNIGRIKRVASWFTQPL